jgi:hypothetical protein
VRTNPELNKRKSTTVVRTEHENFLVFTHAGFAGEADFFLEPVGSTSPRSAVGHSGESIVGFAAFAQR